VRTEGSKKKPHNARGAIFAKSKKGKSIDPIEMTLKSDRSDSVLRGISDKISMAAKTQLKIGKHSFSEADRVMIFDFVIKEIRKYSNCHIALCKESAEVWNQLGLDLSKMRCVCQLDYADMTVTI